MTGQRGASLLDALAATLVAGGAVAIVAQAACVAGVTARVVRRSNVVADLAGARLDALRATPAPDGRDTVVLGVDAIVHRQWSTTGGRGLPRLISVDATYAGRTLRLRTEHFR